MASILKLGSKGDEVKKLQEQLNSSGNYNLNVDGVYGQKTLSAIKDYQTKQGLTVDGIAGSNTLGSLTSAKASSNTTAPGETTNNIGTKAPSYNGYNPSDTVNDAYSYLQNLLNNKPGDYTSSYGQQIQDVLDQIMNREQFSYDFNGDPLYQLYKDQYVQGGKTAMDDTMARAAALTGGYGNSYASTAGNQAYQQYLTGLNDVVPELQQLAHSQYQSEGQDMQNRLSVLSAMDADDYGKYQDKLNQYSNELNYAYNDYSNERGFDYGSYADEAARKVAQSETAWNRKYQEAVLAAQYGDTSKLKAMGINVANNTNNDAQAGSEQSQQKQQSQYDYYHEWVVNNKGTLGAGEMFSDKTLAEKLVQFWKNDDDLDIATMVQIASEQGFLNELNAVLSKSGYSQTGKGGSLGSSGLNKHESLYQNSLK